MSALLFGHFPQLDRRAPKPRPTPGYTPPRLLDLPAMARGPVLVDLRAQLPFGELVVEGPARSTPRGRLWPCRCSCGGFREVSTHDLVRGAVRSCGCLLRAPRLRVVLPPLPPSKTLWLCEWRGLRQRDRAHAPLWISPVTRRPLVEIGLG